MAALEDGAALERIGETEDIARIVVFLASDDAGWITGERIRASGGMHLWACASGDLGRPG